MDSNLDSDDSVTFVDSIELGSNVKQEPDSVLDSFHNAICDSKTVLKKPEQIDTDKQKEMRYPDHPMPINSRLHHLKKIPFLFNGTYFKLVKTDLHSCTSKSKTMLAECNFCEPGKLIKGTLNITSNFLSHLKRQHPSQYAKYLKERPLLARSSVPLPKSFSGVSPSSSTGSSMNESIEELELSFFDDKILTFVIENALPLSIVQTPSFKSLFDETKLTVKPNTFFAKILDSRYSRAFAQLRDILADVSYFCTTFNVWLAKGKFVFGYTCHWINESFCRRSAVLGFRSFSVDKACQRIPEYFHTIHYQYGITEDRIVSSLTNSDDDVIRGFGEFGLNDYYEVGSNQEDEERAQNLTDMSEFDKSFPERGDCVVQNLFALVTTDFIELLKLDEKLFQLHRNVFGRCSEIWTKCTSTQKCDKIKSFIAFPSKYPTSTDWTTLYDCVRAMINNKEKLTNLCVFLDVPFLTPIEIEYLEEYCQLMEPMASALKFLQTESQMLYGYFLPSLVTIKVKLHKLDFYSFKHLSFAGEQIGNKLFERFQNFYEIRPECINAVIAAVSCPVIKFKFVKALSQIVPKVTTESIRSYFINYAKEFQGFVMENHCKSENTSSVKMETSVDESFFDFEQCSKAKDSFDPEVEIKNEINRYLADDDHSLSSLERYPIVKRLFLKYNTTIPSYASVRRLFAYSGLTSCKRNLKMSGRHFERLVFMKAFECYEY